MFDSSQLTINCKLIFIIILFKIFLYSFTNADEHDFLRYKRDIGGESLDTSNFVLYIDPNGTRFIEVPREFMNNWLDDQKMWRRWSIILAIMCFIFFGTLLFFLIHGFWTSTGPFATCTKHANENLFDDKISSSAMTIPIDSTQKNPYATSQQTFVNPYHLSVLQSSAQIQLK